jgi:hypothetical protein
MLCTSAPTAADRALHLGDRHGRQELLVALALDLLGRDAGLLDHLHPFLLQLSPSWSTVWQDSSLPCIANRTYVFAAGRRPSAAGPS